MKVAIVHEWLIDWAGSERVLEQIIACYPEADLFVLADFLSTEHRAKLHGKKATTSFIQRLPFAKTRLAAYLPLMPMAVEQIDLSGYDLILSSSHAVAKGVIVGPDQIHLSYIHSPMRYAWDQQRHYLRESRGKGVKGFATRSLLHYLRIWDVRSANGVEAFAANSRYVARRIWRTYRRDATVIYPPVDLGRLSVRSTKADFFLCAGRLMPYKRVDIVVQAFARMRNKKLVIVGTGPEYKSLRKAASPNITFLGYQSDEVLIEHLQNAKALIFAAEEDFGILPVEAQACGTPVIAFGRGGACETIRDATGEAPTGLFFESQSPGAVTDAVIEFELRQEQFSAAGCRANAQRFSNERFRSEFENFVSAHLERRKARSEPYSAA